ncbi:MAG: PIN domain-containing protein [Thermoanaerobaculia bacterium]|nr:PIN domain-containing protein [Thermoanaerobaculia bacterium]
MARTILVPDTNVFLHYPPPYQLDWLAFAPNSDGAVTVLITMAVVHELDDKKIHPHLGRRATDRLRYLRGALGTEIRPGVRLEIEVHECLSREFIDHVLSFDRPDDHVLLRAWQLQEAGETVVVVTDDTGMDLKGETLGLCIADLDRGKRLKDPESEQAKKLRRVEEELAQLRARKADLRVLASVDDDSEATDRLEIQKPVPRLVNPEEAIARIQGRFSMLPSPGKPQGYEIMRPRVTDDQVRSYNANLEEYFEQLEQYYPEYNRFQEQYVPRLVEFDLWLENNGTLRSEEIDVDVFAPDPPVLMAARVARSSDRKRWVSPPAKPSPPKEPEPRDPILGSFDPTQYVTPFIPEPRSVEPPRVTRGHPRPVDGGCSWRISVRYLRHGDCLKLGRYAVLFENHDWRGFQLKCSIRDTTNPSEIASEVVIRSRSDLEEADDSDIGD